MISLNTVNKYSFGETLVEEAPSISHNAVSAVSGFPLTLLVIGKCFSSTQGPIHPNEDASLALASCTTGKEQWN